MSEFGLNFRNFLVWIESEFCQCQSEFSSGNSDTVVTLVWFFLAGLHSDHSLRSGLNSAYLIWIPKIMLMWTEFQILVIILMLIWMSFCILELSFVSTVHSLQCHPYLTLSLMYFNKLCMVVFLNYLGFVTWSLKHQVVESLLVWISSKNSQIGLNLVWISGIFWSELVLNFVNVNLNSVVVTVVTRSHKKSVVNYYLFCYSTIVLGICCARIE